MAAELMVNIYVPFGAARRQEREREFYNGEITYLLRASPSTMIMGGL